MQQERQPTRERWLVRFRGKRESVWLQLVDHDGEEARRDGQVEGMVPAGAAGGIQFVNGAFQVVEGCVTGQIAGDERHGDRRRASA